MTYTVLATDRVSKTGLAPLIDDDLFDVIGINDSSKAEFSEVLPRVDALIVRSATKVDATLIDQAPSLKAIGRAGAGVDNVDVDHASSRGIAVFNAPGGNTVAAAELTLALMLSLVRRVTEADRSIREGRWERARFRGIELRGRTLGLIGAGRIGSEVAKRCLAFEMKVLVYDPGITVARAAEIGVESVGLDRVLKKSDVISLHVPLNDETRDLIDEAALRRMKKRAFLINASRGGVIDETALVAALMRGEIAGAALDVFETEPLPKDSPLLSAPNLVLTPHLGASTKEAQVSVAREVAVGIRAALVSGDVSRAVNAAQLRL